MTVTAQRQTDLEAKFELAIENGASIEDLQALLAEEMGVEFDEDGTPLMVVQEDIEATDEAGIPQVKQFKTIMDRAGGDPEEAMRIAEWLLAMRAEGTKLAAQVKSHAAWQREQVDAWEAKETKRVTGRFGWIDWLLEIHLRQTCPNPKDEINLTHGRVRWAKQRSHIVWNEDAALKACLTRDDVDEVAPRKLSKATLKAKLEKKAGVYFDAATGEAVDFVEDVEPEFAYLPEIKQEIK